MHLVGFYNGRSLKEYGNSDFFLFCDTMYNVYDFYTLTIPSVYEAAKKLNAEMKTLICELDDLPTPVLGSPVDDHVTTSEEVKVKEETTPESTGGRSVYTKALYCRSLFVLFL
jgi:hypothetical protein